MTETECQDCLKANIECSLITQQKQMRRRSKCDFKATRTKEKDGHFEPIGDDKAKGIIEDSFR
jgi:hypothetical protein